jgi:hypothetical protein
MHQWTNWEAVFSVRFAKQQLNSNRGTVFSVVRAETLKPEQLVRVSAVIARVEASSNSSTVALRVVGGDEKGMQCLGV